MRLSYLAVIVTLTGCSSQAWYEGSQESQRQRCYQQTDNIVIQQCLDAVQRHSWSTYKEERKAVNPPSAPQNPQP